MKQLQLFLLPFAGGSTISFKKLVTMIDSRIEPITIEYAGRMTRRKENYIKNYKCFLRDVVIQIQKQKIDNMPYAVFGYSLGSVLAYDLLSQRMLAGIPVHAFVCAKGSLIEENRSYSEYSESDFIQEIAMLGGTDERILINKRFRSIYLEPIKADYAILEQYIFEAGKIPCDTTVIYCEKDPAAYEVHDWTKLVEGTVDYYEMGSDHFFIKQHWQEVAEIINGHLEEYLY